MTVVDDVDRVADLVEASGSAEHWAWMERWTNALDAAVEAEDEDLCENLHIALIVWERTELNPSPQRLIPADQFIRELGFGDLLDTERDASA